MTMIVIKVNSAYLPNNRNEIGNFNLTLINYDCNNMEKAM